MRHSADNQSTVIFVHGLWMTGLELCLLRRRVARDGYNTCRFRYFSLTRSMDEHVVRLHQFIQQHSATTLHLVGHSLGGLLILQLLQQYDDIPPGRVVLLGSPVCGSQVARVMKKQSVTRPLLGKSGADVLAEQHDPQWNGNREIGIIAGTTGIGVGRLFTRLSKPHDGTVAVAETHLEGATDTMHLPATHTSLVYSGAAADAVRHFLEKGYF
ncbi:MAG TPA: alpha/beta fold hydrolase [Gammaproteobacteria bacterium]|nr:alpha/beta fold hydrolase [Gammaproteobacteria bacterium]